MKEITFRIFVQKLNYKTDSEDSEEEKVFKLLIAEMSLDIKAVLSSRETDGAPSLLPHLVSSASPASLQTQLTSLLRRLTRSSLSDLLTILSSSSQLCRTNGESLVPLLVKHLQRPGLETGEQRLVCSCLSLIVENSLTTSEAGRTISTSASALISVILSCQSGQTLPSALTLLAVLMRKYPGSCGQSRPRIEEKVFSLIESGEKAGVRMVGRLLSLVCQVGGGGREGVDHTNQHSALLASLLSTIHSGISEVFSGVKEVDSYSELVSQGAPIKMKSANICQRALQVETLMEVMGEMLTVGFPQARPVSVENLLSVVVRVILMEVKPGDSPHSQLVSSLHSLLSCSSLSLLTSLLASLGSQLTSCAGHINSLLLTGLARAEDKRVRVGLYFCLSQWLETAGLNSGLEHCAATLVSAAVKDLVPVRQKMKLQTTGQKNKKKKSEVKEAEEQDTVDPALAVAAVRCVERVVRVVGGWLQPSSETELTRCLLSSLLSPAQPSLTSALLSCLQTVVTSPLNTSPAQLALPLLARISNSPGLSTQARQGLTSLSLMMHPTRLTLDTDNTVASHVNTLTEPDQIAEEAQLSSASTQTSEPEPLHQRAGEAAGADLKIVQERMKQMEAELSKVKKSEASARAELLKRDLEISQLKTKSEKRTSQEVSEKETEHLFTKKVKYTASEEEDHPSPAPQSSNQSAPENGDSLTVDEMMKDFSDKLNENIVPKFTTDSDSD